MSNVHEYQSPALYDCEYGNFTADFDVFCKSKTGKDALDIACGTGRITIELAKAGFNCVGIDENEAMILHAKNKSEGLDTSYLVDDMKCFALTQKFDLITMAGNSFQALLTTPDQLACLSNICSHLKEDGVFIMNTRNPSADEMKSTKDFEHWHDFVDDKERLVKVYGQQHLDAQNNIVHYKTKRVWDDHETLSEISLKFTNLQDLLELLNKAGLKLSELYGGFNKEAFDQLQSKSIIVICQKGRENE